MPPDIMYIFLALGPIGYALVLYLSYSWIFGRCVSGHI